MKFQENIQSWLNNISNHCKKQQNVMKSNLPSQQKIDQLCQIFLDTILRKQSMFATDCTTVC